MGEATPPNCHIRHLEALKRAFEGRTMDAITIPMRDCSDVPDFIKRVQAAQAATRKNSIKFGNGPSPEFGRGERFCPPAGAPAEGMTR